MAGRDSRSGMSKPVASKTMENTGIHCPVCGSPFEMHDHYETVVLVEDLNEIYPKGNTRKNQGNLNQRFLRHVNALMNGSGGIIYCHLKPCLLEKFLHKVSTSLTRMLGEDELFYDVYDHYPVGPNHVIFQVKPRLPGLNTLDFKTKISTASGIVDPTLAQTRRLLCKDSTPPDCYSSQLSSYDFKEGHVIPDFQESVCVRAKAVKRYLKPTSDMATQIWRLLNLPKHISAFTKLAAGGSIFGGVVKETGQKKLWTPVLTDPRVILRDPRLLMWEDPLRGYLIIGEDDNNVPDTTFPSGIFVCEGIRLTESEKKELKSSILLGLKSEMLWIWYDGHRSDEPALPVELVFHEVAADNDSNLCVIEIKVKYFPGLCFTHPDGPESHRLRHVRNGIADIERRSIGHWLDDLKINSFDRTSYVHDPEIVSVESGVYFERLDDFLSDSEEESDRGHEEREQVPEAINVKPLTAGELFTSNPIFSTYWQFSAKFTRNGGLLKPEDSDVMLLVPEEAVNIPSDIPTYDQPDATERMLSDTESPVDQKSQVVPDIAEAVEIKMAVSTDLERAKKDLKLAETEQIVSPVAEFYAGKDFIFAKQVRISLPHFLPVGFDENQVKVYHVHRDASGRLLAQTIPKWTADNPGDSEDFYMFGEQEIQVMTNHFSGVLCSYCKQEETTPHLKLRMYGKQTKRKRMEVDLKLLVWDQKLSIRDFRKLALPDAKEESTLTSERVLNPVLDASGVELGVQLDMRQEDIIEWEHKFLNSKFPNTRREELTSLLACGKAANGSTNQGPVVIDWAFQHRDQSERSEDQWFSCTIDVGYVKEEKEGSDDNAVSALQFLRKPKKLTLPVNDLKSNNFQIPPAVQDESVHPKLLYSSEPAASGYTMEEGAVGGEERFEGTLTNPSLQNVSSFLRSGVPRAIIHQQMQGHSAFPDLTRRDREGQDSSNFMFSREMQSQAPMLHFHDRVNIGSLNSNPNCLPEDTELNRNHNPLEANSNSLTNTMRCDRQANGLDVPATPSLERQAERLALSAPTQVSYESDTDPS